MTVKDYRKLRLSEYDIEGMPRNELMSIIDDYVIGNISRKKIREKYNLSERAFKLISKKCDLKGLREKYLKEEANNLVSKCAEVSAQTYALSANIVKRSVQNIANKQQRLLKEGRDISESERNFALRTLSSYHTIMKENKALDMKDGANTQVTSVKVTFGKDVKNVVISPKKKPEDIDAEVVDVTPVKEEKDV